LQQDNEKLQKVAKEQKKESMKQKKMVSVEKNG